MELLEVRRLTGPNLLLDGPAAVMDVASGDAAALGVRLRTRVDTYLAALGWSAPITVRVWDGGLTLAYPADVDALYAACEVLERVWDELLAGHDGGDVDPEAVQRITASAAEERDPAMRAMLDAATQRGVAALWDDDEVSVGLGAGSVSWSRGEVPAPDDVDWSAVHDVPAALVTGTNGKSTTVRMLAAILRADGRHPGNSSTDGIVVDGELVERGDWSGPGGGRTVARDRRVGTMVLEVARGGLLRRGLPVERAEVAVVTNIADDHLGEYGSETVEDLAHAKLVVAKAVRDSGVLVVNAQDPFLLDAAARGPRTWWFAVDEHAPGVARALADGSRCFVVSDSVVMERSAEGDTPIVAVAEIPAAMGGAAGHNVANALAAAAAARALGVAPEVVGDALRAFVADAQSNPGRANRYELDGVTVIVDFAHNVHGVTAMANLVRSLPANRRLVLFSQAGDRPDPALAALAGAVARTEPDAYVVADVPGYLRGREPMEVPAKLAAGLVAAGASADVITHAADAVVGTEHALDWARSGDALLLLVLEARSGVRELLHARGAVEV